MSCQYILALDQGTTSSRAIVFRRNGTAVAMAQKEFPQHFPEAGWVEHDAEQIWASQLAVAKSALRKAKLKPADIAAIGIANQRETTVVWDRESGKPIHKAIVWQDRRTAGLCDDLKKPAIARRIREKTGLLPDAYFSGTKIQWLLDNVPGARKRAEAGQLAFGTIDSWLIWHLTNGEMHITDPGNACRTMLFDIHQEKWDRSLCKRLNVPMSMLPTVCSSSEVYAETKVLGGRIPIAGIAGDQQAALFGQCCFQPGMVKNTYGTGCFMLMNTGNQPVQSTNNLLTSIAWKIGEKTTYALEGSIFVAGAVVQWLRDGLGLFKTSAEVEALAAQVPDSNGVYFVPAFSGLGAPHWDQYARGTIVGMTRGTTRAHLARAALDGIAYQVADVLQAMQADSGLKLKQLRVDGGASMNALLMQFQADLLRVPVVRPVISETTALGAAYLAGLAVGFWKNQQEISTQWQQQAEFRATMKKPVRDQKMQDWERALKRSMNWMIPD